MNRGTSTTSARRAALGFAPRHPPRRAGALAALLIAGLLSPLVAQAKPASADPIANKRAEAARLAAQIQTQGMRVNALSEAYDAARIKVSAVDSRLSAARTALARTQAQVGTLEGRLSQDAVTAYVNQGSGIGGLQALLQGNQATFAVEQQYLATLADREQSTVDALHIARRSEAAHQATLVAAQGQARSALASVAGDRQAAVDASNALQSTLSQVKGQLATLVAQAQAAAAAARMAAARAAAARAVAEARSAAQAQAQAAAQQAQANQAAANQAAANQAAANQGGDAGPSRPRRQDRLGPTTLPSVLSGLGGALAPVTSGPFAGASPAPPPPASAADVAVRTAEAQVGKPYVWGASGPGAFDCSGLVMYAWQAAGVSLPHYTVSQFDSTTRISAGDLAPGDLVFWDFPGEPSPGHVGIYVGGGSVVAADTSGTPVRMESMYFDGTPVGYGRVS